MVNLLSIVMACYNKRQILINTLSSINHFGRDYPIELIVVDDASTTDQQINDIPFLFPDLNIKLLVIKRKNDCFRGPSIACNTALNYAQGNVLLLNNADCLHLGNIIEYVFNNFKLNTYLTFSAYRGWSLPEGIFDNLDWDNDLDSVLRLIGHNDKDSWHFHSILSPKLKEYSFLPYSAAISRKNMETLSGYDERFSMGIGFEDSDLCVRILNLGLEVILVDNPFCVHQRHPPTVYNDDKNPALFQLLQQTAPKRIKVTTNKTYNIP